MSDFVILPIAQIKQQARVAALAHSNIADCCPYPSDSDAGNIFRAEFEKERCWMDRDINVGAAIDIKHSLDQFQAIAA